MHTPVYGNREYIELLNSANCSSNRYMFVAHGLLYREDAVWKAVVSASTITGKLKIISISPGTGTVAVSWVHVAMRSRCALHGCPRCH